mmetsp:Transcript_9692/g.24154  ORF Transcript_9692/g.24154 Transcript_9692/m.24154 type:complete len:217 (-) Transcript_9692:601-1251(-)
MSAAASRLVQVLCFKSRMRCSNCLTLAPICEARTSTRSFNLRSRISNSLSKFKVLSRPSMRWEMSEMSRCRCVSNLSSLKLSCCTPACMSRDRCIANVSSRCSHMWPVAVNSRCICAASVSMRVSKRCVVRLVSCWPCFSRRSTRASRRRASSGRSCSSLPVVSRPALTCPSICFHWLFARSSSRPVCSAKSLVALDASALTAPASSFTCSNILSS